MNAVEFLYKAFNYPSELYRRTRFKLQKKLLKNVEKMLDLEKILKYHGKIALLEMMSMLGITQLFCVQMHNYVLAIT